MSKTVLKVENLSKQYRLGEVGTGTLSHDLNRWWSKLRGKDDPYLKIGETNDQTEKGGSDYVWALKDINFEVKQGEVLGIIGKNGAGKSTLLKILSKVTGPTTGTIKAKGRVASLLEVGTGFHPEMTGRENVYMNGTIMGMSRHEITRKLEEIVDFAGVAKYLDTPVKRYSSGMKVRLGFSVAAHLEPEILIVDEVLAVGDAEFQKKAIGKMQDVSKGEGRTILFVSHNMDAVRNLCTRVLMLVKGKVTANDDANKIVAHYLNFNLKGINEKPILHEEEILKITEGVVSKTVPKFRILKIGMFDNKRNLKNNFLSTEEIHIRTTVKLQGQINDFRLMIELVDDINNCLVLSQISDDNLYFNRKQKIADGTFEFLCKIPANVLSEHRYYLSIEAINPRIEHHRLTKILAFDVKFMGYNEHYGKGQKSLLRPLFNWQFTRI